MKQTPATRRLNEQAREAVASILVSEVSDPRLEFVTVTGAQVSTDRSWLEVFVSCEPERYDEALAGLESARGRIRSLLGRALGWRVTPELRFHIDESVDSGMRIEEALLEVPPTLAAARAAEAEGADDAPDADAHGDEPDAAVVDEFEADEAAADDDAEA